MRKANPPSWGGHILLLHSSVHHVVRALQVFVILPPFLYLYLPLDISRFHSSLRSFLVIVLVLVLVPVPLVHNGKFGCPRLPRCRNRSLEDSDKQQKQHGTLTNPNIEVNGGRDRPRRTSKAWPSSSCGVRCIHSHISSFWSRPIREERIPFSAVQGS
jgi:hypothetical protein